jgi:hypothetical protein
VSNNYTTCSPVSRKFRSSFPQYTLPISRPTFPPHNCSETRPLYLEIILQITNNSLVLCNSFHRVWYTSVVYVPIDLVHTHASMLTGPGHALIKVGLAVGSCEAGWTHTGVAVHAVQACAALHAWGGRAFVNVHTTTRTCRENYSEGQLRHTAVEGWMIVFLGHSFVLMTLYCALEQPGVLHYDSHPRQLACTGCTKYNALCYGRRFTLCYGRRFAL